MNSESRELVGRFLVECLRDEAIDLYERMERRQIVSPVVRERSERLAVELTPDQRKRVRSVLVDVLDNVTFCTIFS